MIEPARFEGAIVFQPEQQELRLSTTGLPAGRYEWRIEPPGLRHVETGGDVNEPGIIYLPPPKPGAATEAAEQPAENIFFFNDLRSAPGWELVAAFPPEAQGTWKLNGRFSPLGGAIRPAVAIPVEALEVGENLLHVRSEVLQVPVLHFRRQVTTETDSPHLIVQVTRPDWQARVSLSRLSDDAAPTRLTERMVAGPELSRQTRSVPARWWEDRVAVAEAAVAVGRSLLASQVQRPGSVFDGGFNLVYDTQRQAHRMSHWLWAWGPSINLLIDLSKLDAARQGGWPERFRAAAIAAGQRSLTFEMEDPRHPAFGVSTVRWEPSRATPQGWAEYISTADSLFLAGWGWMSLYRETGDAVYLERMKKLVAAAERLMDEYPVIPQDWIVERDTWTPHTLDESVFGTIGFRRLYEATQSARVAAVGRRFLDSHLEHMGREGGLLMRAWLREENRELWDPDIKGHAWVIEGYLDAYRLSGDNKYLERASRLAERVMDFQSPDGSWTYLFKRAEPGDPSDDKGTAIWAFLYYDLYESTKNPAHLAAARAALGWCLRQQYRGDDPHLDGALLHSNSMAYVRRRPMTILYSTTFFGLALLEELKLQAGSR